MKHNVFTAMLLVICCGGFASFGLLRTQYAADVDCTPDSFNINEEYVGCPNLKKTAHWTVVFPNAGQFEMYPTGTGQCNYGHPCCDNTPRSTECWPAFNQPIEIYGKWSLLVTNKIAPTSSNTCSPGVLANLK